MIWLTLVSLLILTVMVRHNWATNKNTIFLGLLLGFVSLYCLTHYWMAIDFQPTLAAIFFNHFTPFYLVTGPLLFWYVRGVLKDEFFWKNTDWYHLIPFFIQVIAISPYTLGNSFDSKVEMIQELNANPARMAEMRFNFIFSTSQNSLIRLGLFLIYLIASFSQIVGHLKREKTPISITLQRSVVVRWLIYLHISLLVMLVLYLVFLYRFGADTSFLITPQSATLQTIIAALLIINNLSLLLFPELLFGIIRSRPSATKQTNSGASKTGSTHKSSKNISQVPFKDQAYFAELGKRFKTYMKAEQPYLAKGFDLSQASSALQVPQHHLTLCIREVFDDNFSGVRNAYRVRYSKKLLKDPELSQKTIDAIADESGFSSRTSFYKAFDRETGMSPADYRK